MTATRTDDAAALRDSVLLALAVLGGEGLIDRAYGHVSVRVPGTEHCYINGHIHDEPRTLDDLDPVDVIRIDLDGAVMEGDLEPPGEYPIHTEIYRAREDVGAVVHSHAYAPVCLSVAGHDVLPVGYRGSMFSPRVPTFRDPSQIETSAKGAEMTRVLGDERAVVLHGHGVVCVGGTVAEAVLTTLALEAVARLQLDALRVGELELIREEELGLPGVPGPRDPIPTHAWNYYVARYGRAS